MVLNIPIACEFFYEYLDSLPPEYNAPTYFALYADLRYYDKACNEDKSEDEKFDLAQ